MDFEYVAGWISQNGLVGSGNAEKLRIYGDLLAAPVLHVPWSSAGGAITCRVERRQATSFWGSRKKDPTMHRVCTDVRAAGYATDPQK